METSRHKFGDTSLAKPGLVFFRYARGKEVWLSPERIERKKQIKRACDKRFREKPSTKEKARTYARNYYHRPYQKAKQGAYAKRPEVRAKYRRKYWENRESILDRQKKYHATQKARARMYAYRRTPEYRARTQAAHKAWRKTPEGRLAHNLRERVRAAFRLFKGKGYGKRSKSTVLFGCDFATFKAHLESQFHRGMSWNNYGHFWHIDHKTPIAAFDLSTEAGQRAAFHYTNTQPLWADENLQKNDSLDWKVAA